MIIGVREYTIPLHYKSVLLIVSLVSNPCTCMHMLPMLVLVCFEP